jgi:hypothetical protein
MTAVAGIALAFAIISGPSPSEHEGQKPDQGKSSTGGGRSASRFLPHSFLQASDRPIYPEEWRSSLDEALVRIAFDAYVPAVGSPLSVDDLSDVFVFPDGSALVLGYPPIESTDGVRQNFVEVYESAWSEEGDALTKFQTELEANPTDGQALSNLADGTPVLTVQPRSTDDVEHANPAYLEFDLNGTYVQISGGNSLDHLLSIANGLIRDASSST